MLTLDSSTLGSFGQKNGLNYLRTASSTLQIQRAEVVLHYYNKYKYTEQKRPSKRVLQKCGLMSPLLVMYLYGGK